MRKLTIESLQVESFETSSTAPAARGTVQGHAGESGDSVCHCSFSRDWRCRTYDPRDCADTAYLDCTLVCSNAASCIPC